MLSVTKWFVRFLVMGVISPFFVQRTARLYADSERVVDPQRPDCEYYGNTDGVKCLPSFIIAGTQKSGTTVLAALLSDHADIVFSRKKEAHFFDKTEASHTSSYLKLFPVWNSEAASARIPLFGEATPFYLASRKSCKKIARMLPHVKMIVLLREPTSRAYSEYNMKSRRVSLQEDFFRKIEKAKSRLRRCMKQNPLNYSAIQNCVPSSLAQHERWVKLQNAWKRSVEKNTTWDSVINNCFPSAVVFADPSMAPSRSPIFMHRNTTSKAKLKSKSEIIFNATSCWQHYKGGLETIKPLLEAMVGEINEFQTCRENVADEAPSTNTSELDRLDRVMDRCLRVSGGISTQYFYRSMYAVQLHHCFKYVPKEQFLILPSGRLRRDTAAVYSEVLAFLGLQPDLPRQAPAPSEVSPWSTYGVDMNGELQRQTCDAGERESHANQATLARDAVARHFPSFARNTGWSIQSEYAPLPGDIQQHMQKFFQEQNELLFQLLGRNLEQDW